MKITKLEEIILKNSSKFNLNRGKEILQNKDLIKISIHKSDENYNIYGIFKSKNMLKNHNAHLKVDFKNEKIAFAKCSCDMYLEVESKNNIYLCEHLVAIGLKFVEEVKKKLKNKIQGKERFRLDKNILNKLSCINKNDLNNNGVINSDVSQNIIEKLEINVSLKEVYDDKIKSFDASFYVGSSYMHPILNIDEFIKSIISSKEYYIGKGLIYTPNKYYFSNEDRDLLNYIYEYMLISKYSAEGKTLRIPNDLLKRFLEKIPTKKIKFIYNYQTYISAISFEDLPISFTLKEIKSDYVLTTKKVFPIPLNEKMDVFFYDRKIYIPSTTQLQLYKIFYKPLKEEGKITFFEDTTVDELNSLISSLSMISNNIMIEESIINKIGNNIKIEFDFHKREEEFCCDVSLIYDNTIIPYKEAINSTIDIVRESKKLRLIESHLNKNRFFYKNDTFVFYGSDDEYYNFLKYGLKSLKELGKVSIIKNQKYFELNNGRLIDAYLNESQEDNMMFSFNLNGIDNSELKYIINGYKNNKSYIKLKDNTFVDLEDNNELRDFINLVESLNININENSDSYLVELNKLYYLNNKLGDKKIQLINGKEKILEVLKRLNKLSDNIFEVPKELNANLRDYQVKGYNWLKNLSDLGLGGILGDEMGLGKTIQTITFLLSEKSKTSMIVTPTSLIYNWNEEFNRFAKSLRIGIIHGSKKDRMKVIDNIKDYDVILTTYGTIRKDYLEYENLEFDYLIIDEGQNINNPKAQITQILKKIKSNSKFVLTGTPIENNLLDLWSLFDFIMPDYLYTKEEFTSKFIKGDEEALENLKLLINPYILRRLKKDVIKELPDKIENKIIVEMTSEQKKLYEAFIKKIQNDLKNSDKNKNNITIFSYLTRLRQICLDPSIIMDDYTGGSAKIEIAKEFIMDNVHKHKILLFSQFTSVLNRIADELKSNNVGYYYLDGNTPSKTRINLVDKFNKSNDIKVFLISLKAGGTGLNLTSADIVIHFDPWWNPSVEDQATDRAHRIGQKHIVEVIKLIARGTIEEKILLLQEDKKSLINDVITGKLKDESLINKLNNEEILNLILE